MKKNAILLALFLGLVTMGCATIPGDPTRMTAEQLKEVVKDKNANVGCAAVKAPYPINMVYLVLDKGIVLNGSVTVDADCKITITNEPKPKP